MKFSALAMLYASHVIDGTMEIDEVPKMLKSQIEKIVNDASKKVESEN